jgi:uncharacterized protein
MKTFTAFIAGLVFGLGLILSGMADPAKVLGFLDLAGRRNPSLAFVMAGAITVGTLAFGLAARRKTTLLGEPLRLPQTRPIDMRLVAGSVLFGVGWGVAGLCPGPALVALGMGQGKAVIFVTAMLMGMGLFEAIERGRHALVARARAAEG